MADASRFSIQTTTTCEIAPGAGVGRAVDVGVGLGVGPSVGVAVGLGVTRIVGVGVAVGLGVTRIVGVEAGLGVADGAGDRAATAEAAGVNDGTAAVGIAEAAAGPAGTGCDAAGTGGDAAGDSPVGEDGVPATAPAVGARGEGAAALVGAVAWHPARSRANATLFVARTDLILRPPLWPRGCPEAPGRDASTDAPASLPVAVEDLARRGPGFLVAARSRPRRSGPAAPPIGRAGPRDRAAILGDACRAVERFAGAGRQVSMTGLERLAVVNARNPEVGRTDDPRARTFAELVDRRVLDNAYRYATLMLGDRADAEDATHDAALTAWRHLGELRDPAKFEAWFGRIVVNACRDRLRVRRRRPVHLELDPELSTPDANDGLAGRDALANAIRSLTTDHREVVVLRFYADLTVDQIAARTGVGAGTVKSRLHYAMRQLRAAVEAEDPGRFRP